MKAILNLKFITLSSLSVAVLMSFQNCGPGFQTLDIESFSTGSNIAVNVGSNKQNPFICLNSNTQSTKPILRLSRDQYSNTLLNLVGAQAHAQAKPLIEALFSDTLKKSTDDFVNTITDTQMASYQSIAEVVYNYIQSNPSVAQSLAGACLAQTPVTAACRDNFIKSLGLKAFRRPLEATEVTKWGTQVFTLGESPVESVALVTYGMMLSPYFLLRMEVGSAQTPSTNIFDLTPYEVASRLSYDLTDSPPDQALLNAAAANQLSTPSQLSTHVDRLMKSPQGKSKVLAFFNYWLDPHRYSAAAFTGDFLQGIDVVALNNEFERELDQYVEYMVFTKQASLQELLTSRESFARTPAAASIYGHNPVPAGAGPALTSMDRKGLFMRGSVLATEGNETHPILRGVKVRTRFLCETMGLPSGVMTNDPTFFSDEARKKMSTRERTEGLTGSKSCMGCHQLINPLGFAFENFDGLGRTRNVEMAYSSNGTVLAQHPIRTDSTNTFLGGSQANGIRDGLDLIDDMLQENQLPACFLRQSHRFFKIRAENADDSCVLSEGYNKLMLSDTTAPLLEALKNSYIHSSILRRRIQ